MSTTTSLIVQPYPTNDIIARCFIIKFQENERFYTKQMLDLKVTRCLRLDHTFKVASNIGYLRQDGKWITQYGSVLVVLNEDGQAVAWQLTNSTSLDEVCKLLCDLKERIETSKLTIYVDNCCQIRKKLQQIFGMDTIVKLDVFHAVQRITRAMSKRHILFYPCMNDLRMVFRDPTDIGKKRTMNTPSSSLMLTNMDNFVSKWKNAEHNGYRILTEKVMGQIHGLRVHIQRGCLSNIEPGGGTNYNEALHRHINPHFNHAGRMGLPLAYALLTILLYRHNSRKANSLAQVIGAKLKANSTENALVPFGIIGKDYWMKNISEENDGSELATDEGHSMISVADIEHIFRKALSSADLAQSMCHIVGSSPTFSYHMIPFMSGVPSLYFHGSSSNQCADAQIQAHEKRLSNILDSCNMCKHIIEGDGNCCFSAVAFSLKANFSFLSDSHKLFYFSCGLDLSGDMQSIASQLRKLTVSEWIEHSELYEGFLTDVSIEKEAPKFLVPGYFHGDLADTMLTSLSNVLQTPIIVFSSIACHPFFCVTPNTQTIPLPLMVAFNQAGAGHYDGVISKDKGQSDQSTTENTANSVTCVCGKNSSTNKTHCHEIKHKYTTSVRCACLKNGTSCKVNCRCKNCENPCGQRPLVDVPRRKRAKHDWQEHRQLSSIQFAQKKKEQLSSGPLTKVEFFLMVNILEYCCEEDIDATPDNIFSIYDKIFASVDDPTIPLRPMTKQRIQDFLSLHQKCLTIFTTMCGMQLEWNMSKET